MTTVASPPRPRKLVLVPSTEAATPAVAPSPPVSSLSEAEIARRSDQFSFAAGPPVSDAERAEALAERQRRADARLHEDAERERQRLRDRAVLAGRPVPGDVRPAPAPAPAVGATSDARASYTTATLIADYVKARRARGRAKGTLDFYASVEKPLLRLLPKSAHEIDHARLLGYIETRRAEGAGEAVRKELHSFLRPALKHAYRSRLFDVDPTQIVPELDSLAKPRERWLTPDEAWKIVRWLAARSAAGRDHSACIAWAVAVGAEYGAWARARRDDVRADRRGAQVHGTKRKTRERFSPAPLPEQQALLRYAVDTARGVKGSLFTRWSTTNANADLKEACLALGFAPSSTNDLRRSYASWLGQAGVSDEMIDAAQGRKTTVIARHYRKMTDEDLMRRMEEEIASHARARAALDAAEALPQSAPVPRSEAGQASTDRGVRATDGLIAQSVELRTFNRSAAPDPADDVLLRALDAATIAQQWGAAEAIARAIAARAGAR